MDQHEEEQDKRTRKAEAALQRGEFAIRQLGPHEWSVRNGDGAPYTVTCQDSTWACTCLDKTEGLAHRLGLRCKHIESIRLTLDSHTTGQTHGPFDTLRARSAPTRSTPTRRETYMNILNEWHTLTGLTLGEAIKELKAVLPPSAYKAVPGSQGLTDIDPSYLTEKATEVFGPVGIGWVYTYDQKDLEIHINEKTSSKGREYTEYEVNLLRFQLFFRYYDVSGALCVSDPIPTSGGNTNEVRGYAVRGALTNALGAAFAKLCWQLPIYQGIVDHTNAGKYYKPNGNGAGDNGAKASAAKAAVAPAPAASATPPPAGDAPGKIHAEREQSRRMTVEQALAVVMHLPVKNAPALQGKTLGELNQSDEGRKTIKYLAETWQPNGQAADQTLKQAAEIVNTPF